jgi:hypothetical protein
VSGLRGYLRQDDDREALDDERASTRGDQVLASPASALHGTVQPLEPPQWLTLNVGPPYNFAAPDPPLEQCARTSQYVAANGIAFTDRTEGAMSLGAGAGFFTLAGNDGLCDSLGRVGYLGTQVSGYLSKIVRLPSNVPDDSFVTAVAHLTFSRFPSPQLPWFELVPIEGWILAEVVANVTLVTTGVSNQQSTQLAYFYRGGANVTTAYPVGGFQIPVSALMPAGSSNLLVYVTVTMRVMKDANDHSSFGYLDLTDDRRALPGWGTGIYGGPVILQGISFRIPYINLWPKSWPPGSN